MSKKKSGCGSVVGIVLGVLVCLMCLGVFTQEGSDKPNRQPASKPEPPATPDLEVLDAEWKVEGTLRYIVGSVRNNAGGTKSYVQVVFNLYDESGAQVGSTMANTNNLEAGGTWKFKAIVLQDEATTTKLSGITGF